MRRIFAAAFRSPPVLVCVLRLGMFNLVPGHIVCGLGIAGIGTLPYGLRWLVEGEVGALTVLCTRAHGPRAHARPGVHPV